VCDACRALGADASLKWPNDVLAGGRKLAGILVEAQTRGDRVEHAILGVGVNVGPWDEAASLACGVEEALAAVLPALEREVARFVEEGSAAVVRAFKARCPLLGRRVRVSEGERVVDGTMDDVSDDGALILDGRRIFSGEVVA
jgi:BirA family biotin operon repressor/biotin-[acetyl-CoA-carboxylase] ligase